MLCSFLKVLIRVLKRHLYTIEGIALDYRSPSRVCVRVCVCDFNFFLSNYMPQVPQFQDLTNSQPHISPTSISVF